MCDQQIFDCDHAPFGEISRPTVVCFCFLNYTVPKGQLGSVFTKYMIIWTMIGIYLFDSLANFPLLWRLTIHLTAARIQAQFKVSNWGKLGVVLLARVTEMLYLSHCELSDRKKTSTSVRTIGFYVTAARLSQIFRKITVLSRPVSLPRGFSVKNIFQKFTIAGLCCYLYLKILIYNVRTWWSIAITSRKNRDQQLHWSIRINLKVATKTSFNKKHKQERRFKFNVLWHFLLPDMARV